MNVKYRAHSMGRLRPDMVGGMGGKSVSEISITTFDSSRQFISDRRSE